MLYLFTSTKYQPYELGFSCWNWVIHVNKAVVSNSRFTSTPDRISNKYYLGPAPLEEMARQIATAFGPCGNNRDYLFLLEKAMFDIGNNKEEVVQLYFCSRRGIFLSCEWVVLYMLCVNRSWRRLCDWAGKWSEEGARNSEVARSIPRPSQVELVAPQISTVARGNRHGFLKLISFNKFVVSVLIDLGESLFMKFSWKY